MSNLLKPLQIIFPVGFCSEAVARRCSVKKVFLNISQNSQENIFAWLSTRNFIKKETLVQVFSCELLEILRTPFL